MDERYERGRQRFLEVHDEKALRAVEGLGELGAVVALTALGRSSQLPQHLRAALKTGLTEAELREAIMLTASIAGFPPAMNATATLKNVLAERARDDQDPSS